jgi:hypothetical protein
VAAAAAEAAAAAQATEAGEPEGAVAGTAVACFVERSPAAALASARPFASSAGRPSMCGGRPARRRDGAVRPSGPCAPSPHASALSHPAWSRTARSSARRSRAASAPPRAAASALRPSSTATPTRSARSPRRRRSRPRRSTCAGPRSPALDHATPSARPPRPVGVEACALRAVVRATAHYDNLEASNVELLSAVAAAGDGSRLAGRHEASAATLWATTTVFLPAAFAR